MDRNPAKLLTTCGLIILFSNLHAAVPETSLGEVTQSIGTVTYLSFSSPRVKEVNTKENLLSEGSYLTRDNSILTAKLLDGSWLRLSPRSKIALDIDNDKRSILIHLFTGSLKALVSKNLGHNLPYKLIIKSGDTYFESSEAKFSVVRHPFFNKVKTFVEKGVVTAYRDDVGKNDFQHVHSGEALVIDEKSDDIPYPQKLSAKEARFLKKGKYLK